jgi:hypothetical protein
MLNEPTWMVRKINWWNKPIKLLRKNPDGGLKQVGWVWNQSAYCVNNLYEGWIAFIDDQTEDKLELFVCDHCGSALSLTRQWKIRDHFKKVAK